MNCFKAAIFACLLLGSNVFVYAQNIKINEIMSSNSSTRMDEDGDYSDWIELHNVGSTPVNLQGYGISDDEAKPYKWLMPKVTILPDSFLIVWASGKDRADSINPHANFSISSSGEVIILTLPNSTIGDRINLPAVPENLSYGRSAGTDTTLKFFQKPTPGSRNDTLSFEGVLSAPDFSHDGGVYASPFNLVITASDPEATIIYTLDGSIPDPENLNGTTYQYKNSYPNGPLLTSEYSSIIYNAPIAIKDRLGDADSLTGKSSTYSKLPEYFPNTPVYKGTVVRARVVKPGSMPGEVLTNTYFISTEDRYTLPVVSLAVREDYFFDYEDGIYTAGKDYDNWINTDTTASPNGKSPANYQRDTEYPAHLEIFENSKGRVLSQEVGFRIHGGFTRSKPLKSLRLYARSEYGSSHLNYAFFPHQPYDAYKRILLRPGGNDFSGTLIRDAVVQNITGHLSFETQAFQPSILFINGEYWGIHNFRERYDKHFFERKYGADPDNLDIIFGNREVEEGDAVHYLATMNYIETNGVVEDEHYEYIKTQIDVDNFIDYQLAEIFSGNTDWPGNNIKCWRSKNPYNPSAAPRLDGRWRWMMYDTDQGFGFNNGVPSVDNVKQMANLTSGYFLIRKLLENDSFRYDFINQFTNQLNSALLPEVMHVKINKIKNLIEPEISEHIHRWKAPARIASWEGNMEKMLSYASERPGYVREQLRSFFKLGEDYLLTVNVSDTNQGFVKINKLELHAGTTGIPAKVYPWSGTYFQGVPIKLETVPTPGYKFVKWQGITDSLSPSISVTPSGPISVVAVFEKKPASSVLHYWNFNDTTDIAKVAFSISEASLQTNLAPNAENEFTFGTGGGFIGENVQFGDSAGSHLRVNNPVGSSLEFFLPTVGYSQLYVQFEARRSEKGASQMLVEYSIDGSTFIEKESVIAKNDNPAVNIIDFSNIPGASHNANFKIRIRFLQGQGGLAGNNRIDNFSLNGIIDTLMTTSEMNINNRVVIQSYPNPFHHETNIKINLPMADKLKLTLYDIHGYICQEVVDDEYQAGIIDFNINTGKLLPGVYFIICKTGTTQSQHKIIKY